MFLTAICRSVLFYRRSLAFARRPADGRLLLRVPGGDRLLPRALPTSACRLGPPRQRPAAAACLSVSHRLSSRQQSLAVAHCPDDDRLLLRAALPATACRFALSWRRLRAVSCAVPSPLCFMAFGLSRRCVSNTGDVKRPILAIRDAGLSHRYVSSPFYLAPCCAAASLRHLATSLRQFAASFCRDDSVLDARCVTRILESAC